MFDYKKFFLDLFFPIQCLGCNIEGQWLCQQCLNKIKINSENSFHQLDQGQPLDGVWVAADYNQPLLTKVLHNFKYNFVADLGQVLNKLLIRFLVKEIENNKFTKPDLIAAVPLARKRRLWRGFNQAEILAKDLAQKFDWDLDLDLIVRQYHTQPQVGLKANERLVNVKGIFKINNPQKLVNKEILLIDDVITTGATMQECAKALKVAGAKKVWGLVIAKG